MIYTGIGSREAPEDVLNLMKKIGFHLAKQGLILRSGGAPGSDEAFETGCNMAKGKKEIFLPYDGFRHRYIKEDGVFIVPENLYTQAETLAAFYHPGWHYMKDDFKCFHVRNVCQILGKDLNTPTDFVICYTPGATGSGGTGQAIRIAKSYHIHIIDLGDFLTKKEFIEKMN